MFAVLLILHVLVAFFLVISILLQSGQGGGLSGAFGGGGGNQSLFGGRGASGFLSRATTYLGASFLVLSFLLAFVQAHRSGATRASRNIIQETIPPSRSAPARESQAAPTEGGELPSPAPEPSGTGGE